MSKSTLMTETLCTCLCNRSAHGGNYQPPGSPKYRGMICYGCKSCEQFTVVGTCECGHDAGVHENLLGRFVSHTPCGGEVMGPTTFSGSIVRTMRCTCTRYTASSTSTLGVTV